MGPHRRFCGRCATPTEPKRDERVRVCPRLQADGLSAGRSGGDGPSEEGMPNSAGPQPALPPGMYSALAGFVEPGESLEQCLAREVAEEVGVRVGRARYFASQPGRSRTRSDRVRMRVASGEIRPQAGEIEDANGSKYCNCRNFQAKSRSLED